MLICNCLKDFDWWSSSAHILSLSDRNLALKETHFFRNCWFLYHLTCFQHGSAFRIMLNQEFLKICMYEIYIVYLIILSYTGRAWFYLSWMCAYVWGWSNLSDQRENTSLTFFMPATVFMWLYYSLLWFEISFDRTPAIDLTGTSGVLIFSFASATSYSLRNNRQAEIIQFFHTWKDTTLQSYCKYMDYI